MASLEEMRAALQAKKDKQTNTSTPKRQGDNASYPFWDMKTGSSCLIRFLPDGDPENMFFWVGREIIKLPFAGVVGGDYPTTKDVEVTVPCMHMFGETCPIISATRGWWDGDENQKVLARRYYKKKSYIFQGFVVNSPFEEQEPPENPIRRFMINPSIFEIIEKSLSDPDMEDMPTDYDNGNDFRIEKSQKGQYANYTGSKWAKKSRALSSEEREAVKIHGLFDLKASLGRKPDAQEVEVIKTMFDVSIAGEPFDMEAFGKYYRPYTQKTFGDNTDTISRVAETKTEIRDQEPVVENKPTANKTNSQDILERIKMRTANKG